MEYSNKALNAIYTQVASNISTLFSKKVEDIRPDMRINEDLGLDSLDGVELIMNMEKDFAVEVFDLEALDLKTVDDLVRCMCKLCSPLHRYLLHAVENITADITGLDRENVHVRDCWKCTMDDGTVNSVYTYTEFIAHLKTDKQTVAEIINCVEQIYGIELGCTEVISLRELVYQIEKVLLTPTL
jgi:acyl carrier protein